MYIALEGAGIAVQVGARRFGNGVAARIRRHGYRAPGGGFVARTHNQNAGAIDACRTHRAAAAAVTADDEVHVGGDPEMVMAAPVPSKSPSYAPAADLGAASAVWAGAGIDAGALWFAALAGAGC